MSLEALPLLASASKWAPVPVAPQPMPEASGEAAELAANDVSELLGVWFCASREHRFVCVEEVVEEDEVHEDEEVDEEDDRVEVRSIDEEDCEEIEADLCCLNWGKCCSSLSEMAATSTSSR